MWSPATFGVRLEGGEESVQLAQSLLEILEKVARDGQRIRTRDFQRYLGMIQDEGAGALIECLNDMISTSPKKPPIRPRTAGQKKYIDLIRANTITFGVGPAGTGKTYLAMAMAVSALKNGEVSRLILSRPAVEAGEALGFLPGALEEKISPYLRPLYDALHDMLPAEELQKYNERGILEIAPLAYMRGRTLNNAFIILDESQNATREQMLMFLTRIGSDSKLVITGDPSQVDLPMHRRSGLVEAARKLEGIDGIGIHRFDKKDVVRHYLVQKIIEAYEEKSPNGHPFHESD
ncbi:MAG: PhoH family protein [Verrucomicrobia bacterium]|nr:PhoH family protein [Verrucomicrobiota bacterium]